MTTLTDTFTRANSTTTLGSTESPVKAWSADNGTWGINTNQAYVVTQSGFDSRATVDVGAANMDVSAAITTAQDAGVMASYVDASNYYLAKIISGSVTVIRRQGGSDTTLGSGGTWTDGATLRLVTNDSGSGTQVTAYIGATQVFTTLDTTAGRPAGTRAGFRDGTGGSPGAPRFDNFQVVYTAAGTNVTLTPNPATGSVTVAITGAPNVTPAYSQGTGIDGWATSAPGSLAAGSTAGTHTGAEGFELTRSASTATAVATKTITGLTIGQKYVYTAWLKLSPSGSATVQAGISVQGVSGASSGLATMTSTWVQKQVTFTATATSHTLQANVKANLATTGRAYFDDIKLAPYSVNPTTTVKRTDANGVRDVRRLTGQEPAGGTMTLTDYEAALTGTVQYDVTDTLGVTASASTNLNAVTNPWLNVVTQPATIKAKLDSVTEYGARRAFLGTVHRPVGREFPLIVTGPFASREGTLTVWCPDYATALAVLAVADAGETIMLRQPSYAGMDMYLVATEAQLDPSTPSSAGQRWAVVLTYSELDVPADPLKA